MAIAIVSRFGSLLEAFFFEVADRGSRPIFRERTFVARLSSPVLHKHKHERTSGERGEGRKVYSVLSTFLHVVMIT